MASAIFFLDLKGKVRYGKPDATTGAYHKLGECSADKQS
jgi:hypothetical protein